MAAQNPQQWLEWAQRIQAIAQTGLTYGKDPYDLERYEELRVLAAEICANYLGQPLEQVRDIFTLEQGYPTPKVDVRAAVFNPQGELLLVRERSDGRWSLPGGWADVGESPGEMAVRETREESGFAVRPVKLLAVYDLAKHAHPPSYWHTYKLVLRCDLVGGAAQTSLETDDVGFFARGNMPPLSLSRVTPEQIERLFQHYHDPNLPTDFD